MILRSLGSLRFWQKASLSPSAEEISCAFECSQQVRRAAVGEASASHYSVTHQFTDESTGVLDSFYGDISRILDMSVFSSSMFICQLAREGS
jgi:hypothetical protein